LVKISREKMILRRMARLREIVEIDTQKIRTNLLLQLQDLFHLSRRNAKNEKLPLPQRQKWVRVASFIAQTINGLTKTYDEMQLTKDIERLEQMIREAAEEVDSQPQTV